jgi:CRP-like cAMP-binding protein
VLVPPPRPHRLFSEFIIHKGEIGDSLFFIVNGSVEIFWDETLPHGLMRVVSPGADGFFGDNALFAGAGPYILQCVRDRAASCCCTLLRARLNDSCYPAVRACVRVHACSVRRAGKLRMASARAMTAVSVMIIAYADLTAVLSLHPQVKRRLVKLSRERREVFLQLASTYQDERRMAEEIRKGVEGINAQRRSLSGRMLKMLDADSIIQHMNWNKLSTGAGGGSDDADAQEGSGDTVAPLVGAASGGGAGANDRTAAGALPHIEEGSEMHGDADGDADADADSAASARGAAVQFHVARGSRSSSSAPPSAAALHAPAAAAAAAASAATAASSGSSNVRASPPPPAGTGSGDEKDPSGDAGGGGAGHRRARSLPKAPLLGLPLAAAVHVSSPTLGRAGPRRSIAPAPRASQVGMTFGGGLIDDEIYFHARGAAAAGGLDGAAIGGGAGLGGSLRGDGGRASVMFEIAAGLRNRKASENSGQQRDEEDEDDENRSSLSVTQ